jgi:hypothetical protein
MNTRYVLLAVVVQFICLSSCSIMVEYPPKSKNSIPLLLEASEKETATAANRPSEDGRKQFDTSIAAITDKINKLEQRNESLNKSIVKVTLCSAFVPPVMPEAPRVDFSKLRAIPSNDHTAVKNLLIDNIQAMNDHAKKVEDSLKLAMIIHRRTCGVRDVINKK